jgi:hypothetical protein
MWTRRIHTIQCTNKYDIIGSKTLIICDNQNKTKKILKIALHTQYALASVTTADSSWRQRQRTHMEGRRTMATQCLLLLRAGIFAPSRAAKDAPVARLVAALTTRIGENCGRKWQMASAWVAIKRLHIFKVGYLFWRPNPAVLNVPLYKKIKIKTRVGLLLRPFLFYPASM